MNRVRDVQKILREILSRKDPFGYYVVVAMNNSETRNIISKYEKKVQLVVEELGDNIILRCRSRRVVEELARELILKDLLAEI